MTTKRWRRAFGLNVAIALLTSAAAAAPAQEAVQIGALFTHGKPPATYLSALGGVLSTTIDSPPNGSQLELRLGLGDGACRLWLMWAPDPKTAGQQPLSPTAPVETCLVRDGVSPGELDDWLHGGKAPDPTLRLQLRIDPNGQGDRWTNGADLKASLLVRACGDRPIRHRFYASLTITAGALTVDRGPNQAGQLRMLLEAKSATVGAVDPKTWREVVRGCGNAHVVLPDEPASGVAAKLIGRSDRVVVAGSPVNQSLEEARGVLEDLVASDVLERRLALELIRPLDRVEDALRLARPDTAVKGARHIVARAEQVVPPDNVAAVVGPIVAAVAAITVFGDSLVMPPAGCPQFSPCVSGALLVDAAAKPGRADGTPARPFRTIDDALEAAAAREDRVVVVAVRPGTYPESLAITRHTRIVGTPLGQPRIAGAITQTGPYELTLERVELWHTPGTALHVSNRCAVTALRGVLVTRASGYGIVQEGGTVTGAQLSVIGTLAGSDGRGGRALVLADGTRGFFNQVTLAGNEGQALLLDGEETRLLMVDAHINDNRRAPALATLPRNDPDLITEGGAIVVRNGALLLADWSHVVANEVAGLVVTNRARAHFRDGEITETRSVGQSDGPLGGTNALASGGTLELASFSSSRAPVCGVLVASGGDMRATDGEVYQVGIGACVQVPDFHVLCLQTRVRYHDNGVNLQAESFSLPAPVDLAGASPDSEPAPPPDPTRDSHGCPVVPFNCDWCVRGRR